jgi:hypothetical protein
MYSMCWNSTNNKGRKTSDYGVSLLSLLLAGMTIAIRSSVITVVQFQYALAASADQFSLGYKMLQHVHPRDLINPGAKESSPGHVENTEEEFKLDTSI